ncbi:MAG: hypothetical protein F6K55_09360 [Moorea sp. SIO4A3]|nr:hypothetical protein [Moorena sp. SIO4A3]
MRAISTRGEEAKNHGSPAPNAPYAFNLQPSDGALRCGLFQQGAKMGKIMARPPLTHPTPSTFKLLMVRYGAGCFNKGRRGGKSWFARP